MAQRLQHTSPFIGVQSLDEEAAVEMISLVLETSRHQARPLDLNRLALNVETPDDCAGPSRCGCPDARTRKAAFFLDLYLTVAGNELRVDDVAFLVIDPVGEHAQLYADLRSRDTGASGKVACLHQIFDQSAE